MEKCDMSFELAALPFDRKGLVPYLSEETIEFHYGRHHQTYVNNLNQLLAGKDLLQKPLIDIVRTAQGVIFNNAAQIWNHDFYWRSLQKESGEEKLSTELATAINIAFGSMEEFKKQFTKVALDLFGSGWVWLIKDMNDGLAIVATGNSNTPITMGQEPLMTCDMWEHAYYIDYRNARTKYLEAFWRIVNWKFASQNFASIARK
jgi:Fe-Mn family superoxide dismutase